MQQLLIYYKFNNISETRFTPLFLLLQLPNPLRGVLIRMRAIKHHEKPPFIEYMAT